MNNEAFIKIATLFYGKNDRTILSLAKYYEDIDSLIKIIEKLLLGVFTRDKIYRKKILIKPNWVRHSIRPDDDICLRTNNTFLLATLRIVLAMKPAQIIVGDAPIQGCLWGKMLDVEFLEKMKSLGKEHGIPVLINDFRRVMFQPAINVLNMERNPIDKYIIFDVGKKSFLEPISENSGNLFRVTDYNPDRLKEIHHSGVHKYCLTRELFDADVVISLPKVKTHQKAGITAALKNLVGLNGDKDFLPHHRRGGTGRGGDCYPGDSILRYWAELAMDNANRHRGEPIYRIWRKIVSFLWRLSLPSPVHQMAAGWFGNDTTWRMVMDINRIAIFGNADGTLSPNPVREIYSLCDGIIGGQGDGPLHPDPLPLGVVCFSNDSYLTDICLATLMGFDFRKIPLLNESEKSLNEKKASLILNDNSIPLIDLKNYSIPTLPPPGWIGYI